MKNKFLNLFIIITLILVAFIVYNKFKLSQNSHFTVTADTVIKPGSEISKYVAQEEVDSFSFRYSDIHCDKENNSTLIPLRNALESKDTSKVLKFLKDNNLSADIKMLDGRTPIMYSAFYNDINTTKELINLGANIHIKDRYKLNALAYAVSINSADTVKVLLDNNLTIEETPVVQYYYPQRKFYRTIDKIIIDNDDIQIKYQDFTKEETCQNTSSKSAYETMEYLVTFNIYDTAKVILESGYKPYTYIGYGEIPVYGNYIYDIFPQENINSKIEYAKNSNKDIFNLKLFMDEFSYDYTLYKRIEDYPNHEPMLNLLLDHNVSGQPSKELMKEKCLNDCSSRYRDYIEDKFNLVRNEILKDYNDETKLIKLDFYYKDYKETIKLINDNKIETTTPNNEILEEFNFLTDEIKWYAKYCEEDYMQELKDFTGAGDLRRWTWKEGNKYSGNSNVIKGYENSKATFKDTREFVTFYNERNKRLEIIGLLYSYENCDDKNSPNYKGKEECQYYEKRVYIKNK